MLICLRQVQWIAGRTSHEAIDSSDMFFSDPVEIDSSDMESFDEDDMYGMDHGMEEISNSSDDGAEADVSQSSEDTVVCHCAFLSVT
jgi:hypothetical protein